MSIEEENVIKKLKLFIFSIRLLYEEDIKKEDKNLKLYYDMTNDIQIVLNLVEKQQKQIEDMCENYCPKNTEENTILKCRIDKAIEYIKHNQFIRYQVTLNPSYEMDDYQVKELLKILER